MPRFRGGSVGLLLTAAFLATAPSADASPEDLFGYGTSSPAMGMTGTAIGRGFETTYTNPALLSTCRYRQLSLGFQGVDYELFARGPSAPGTMGMQPLRGAIIGATLPLGFGGVLKDRIALGVGFFTPTDVVVRGRILYPEKPQYSVLGDRAQSVSVQLGLGADIGYGFRVGAGFAALAAIAGTVVVATDESGQVGTKVDDQLVATYAPSFGIAYDLGESYRLGVKYRGVLDGRFAVTILVRDLGSLEIPPFNIAGLAQYDPRHLQLEVARIRGDWRMAIGATYKDWSAYPGPPEPTVLCPPERPDCAALRPPPFEFHDTISPRVGVERVIRPSDALRFGIRGGYTLEPSPAPEQRREMNFYDNTRHVFTLGYGLEMSAPLPPLTIDLFAQYHSLVERTHTKDADIAADNPGWPKVTTGGHVLVGGLVIGVRL